MLQSTQVLSGLKQGKCQETFSRQEISPNYTNDSNISAGNTTVLKLPIKVEPKPKGQPTTSPKVEKCGLRPPGAAAATATAPGTDDPNAAPSDPELPKTPELSEVQFKNI